jgi:hypothetical protein
LLQILLCHAKRIWVVAGLRQTCLSAYIEIERLAS